jgi:hypothetical protein
MSHKMAADWTPRDHYEEATALLIAASEHESIVEQGMLVSRADVHAQLAAISPQNISNGIEDEYEDLRP